MAGFEQRALGESSRHFLSISQDPATDSKGSPPDTAATTSSGGTTIPNRRPRGRPPGSKNKSKAPIFVSQDGHQNSFQSHILEVSAGNDVVESISAYARKRGSGICVLSGSGTVGNVNLRQPAGSVATLHGSFEIISLSGTVLPPPAPPGAGGLSIFMSGGQGRVVGGTVVGPLMASAPVVLMTASFANAVFQRLPLEEEDGGNTQPAASQTSSVTASGRAHLSECIGNGSGGGGGAGGGFYTSAGVGVPSSADLFRWDSAQRLS